MSDSECVSVKVLMKEAPLRSDAVNVIDSVNVLENVFDCVNVLDFVNVLENVLENVFDFVNLSVGIRQGGIRQLLFV